MSETVTTGGAVAREREDRLRQVFDLSDDALVLFDQVSGTITDLNLKTEELFGFDRTTLLESGPLFMMAKLRQEFLREVLAMKERDIWNIDRATLARKEGETITCSIRAKQANLGGRSIIYCSMRDITGRIILEEKTKAGRARLIQSDKMATLGMLISGIAHEINNPNNFIMLNSSLLSEAWQSAMPILDEYCAENGDFKLGSLEYTAIRGIVPQLFLGLTDGSQRIRKVIEKLRDFARQDVGGTTERVDVNGVIHGAITLLGHEIKNTCDNFQMAAAMDLPPALGNAQQIEQVIINLLKNALQALPDKGRCIRVATAHATDTDRIAITVTDEGGGMTEEVLDRLTEPFFTTKGEGASGLGLATAATIVQENHGELSFISSPGKGTTATLMLTLHGRQQMLQDTP